ncbi:unnamed protein product [Phytomonas sp. EM1]|nr:unnamed protein product [Phytomonas sp. EM1]|eukprot:CCW62800.1 unnamed protein product [Phytomonas sp. isolate EM1]
MTQNGHPQGGSLFQQMYSIQQQQQQFPYPQPYPAPGVGGSAPPHTTPLHAERMNGGGIPLPPPPPPPPPVYYLPIPPPSPPQPQDKDYYKGFHDSVVRPSGPIWGSAVSWIAPVVVNMALFILPIWYFRRKYTQSMAAAGLKGQKSNNPMSGLMEAMNPIKTKHFRTEVKGTTFKDVIGIPEAKEDLKQYVDFLKDPKRFTRLGARLPKGCLLTGKPGTGKTLLARALAGESNTPFFSCSGADFIEIFGGSGPKRVRELFEEAKAAAPCVVFIDEIDAIGSRNQGGRSMGSGGSSEENRTINQLLAELDGLSSNEAVVVVAATNYPEALDKALLREGRFDRKVNIPMPDPAARCELFQFYLNTIITGDANCKPKVQIFKPRATGENPDAEASPPPSEDVVRDIKVVPGVSNLEYAKVLADRTPGVSPAQIATIVNEAALNAAMQDKELVPLETLQESIDDVLIGKKHRQRMSGGALHRTAFHEVGHCILAWMNPLQKDVIKLSIIPRGRAGGYTQQLQDEAMEPHTEAHLFSQLCVLMGGRAAERIFEDDISIGAMDDLQRATRLATEKILQYGMSKSLGQIAFKPNDKNDGRAWMTWSEDLHEKVEAEANEWVAEAYEYAEKCLLANRDAHVKLAELLLDRKELNKDDIESVLGKRPTTPVPFPL